jgi:hypothetical protein
LEDDSHPVWSPAGSYDAVLITTGICANVLCVGFWTVTALSPADYTYVAFCEQAMAAGCAGYIVSFLGPRVIYFDRTAETHVEHFPT